MNNQTIFPSLHLTIGCMYAGKTTKLINTYREADKNNFKSIILTHSSENRYSIDEISTHDNQTLPCVKYSTIHSFIENETKFINSSDIILIDEAQFFTDLTDVLILVEKYKKQVHVFGLDGDYKRTKFGSILDIIPLCDTIEKITSNCMCNDTAIFSNRIVHNNEQILVGSVDIYEPLCRSCYVKKNNL